MTSPEFVLIHRSFISCCKYIVNLWFSLNENTGPVTCATQFRQLYPQCKHGMRVISPGIMRISVKIFHYHSTNRFKEQGSLSKTLVTIPSWNADEYKRVDPLSVGVCPTNAVDPGTEEGLDHGRIPVTVLLPRTPDLAVECPHYNFGSHCPSCIQPGGRSSNPGKRPGCPACWSRPGCRSREGQNLIALAHQASDADLPMSGTPGRRDVVTGFFPCFAHREAHLMVALPCHQSRDRQQQAAF